jgi:DNA-directed RNA polymerase specialized sigma24 family protein
MSPLTVRRYRAERLLRREFEALRGRVIATVRARLRGSGVSLDTSDLEACYAQAWQGLYMAVLDGQEIANPAGWLVLVTFRRAIEEHRARVRAHRGGDRRPGCASDPQMGAELEIESAEERDLAAELDDRVRLRQLFEGLRGRLDAREREAAVLCCLQGLSRAQAAERMGVSEARMRKLMEGRGAVRPGVAGKVGTLVETIREGGWCEEQGSLMRGLAYGILDPDGERYQLALMHRSECPACRAYVASLRGLAAAVPPVFLPWGLGAAVLARVGHGAHVGTAAGAASGGTLSASASGAVGAGAGAGGAAGGGWLLAGGPVGAKLAIGCVLALGVGAGCMALNVGSDRPRSPVHRGHAARTSGAGVRAHAPPIGYQASDLATGARRSGIASVSSRATATVPLTPGGRASREFGPEQALAPGAPRSVAAEGHQAPAARSASSRSGSLTVSGSSAGASSSDEVPVSSAGQSTSRSPASGASQAEREFAPG